MATVTHHKADRGSAVFLRKGQEFYASHQYDRAEKALLRAMDMCSCGVAVQNQPRIDYEILKGIEEKKLKDVLSNMSAASRRCNSLIHVDAIDSLIATYEMQSRLDEGLEFALKMVNLSPREPKSYLRLGKVLRLKNLPTTAYYNYKQGMELVKRKYPHHALLPKLQTQKDKVLALATFDPITAFPVELVRMIFQLLDFKELCGCLRVSKAWKEVLTAESLKNLWQVQEYKFTGNSHPGLRRIHSSFKSYVRYAAGALTELSIDNCRSFFQFCKLTQLLLLVPHLKVLKLTDLLGFCQLEEVQGQVKLPKLMNLSLGRGVQPTPRLVQQLLNSSCNSLEELSIFELQDREPQRYSMSTRWDPNWPKLAKLKVIRLSRTNISLGPALDLGRVMELTPNIEEAWFDYFHYIHRELTTRWPKLRSLFVGASAIPIPYSEPCEISEEMRELHLESKRQISYLVVLPRSPHFSRLEKLSLLDFEPLTLEDFTALVRPSLESGTIQELDVRPLPAFAFFSSFIPLDWFKSNSLTYLSLTGFTRQNLHEHRRFEEVVLGIIDRFPNLRSVDIGNEVFADTLLAKMVQKGVKTIYCRPSQPRVDLRCWASSKFGAEIIMKPPPHLPAMHPGRRRPSCYL
ncbi:hypothetical protein F5Y05DRAFT_113380 [Hypoxylon sp. FL0543]|nr:hypothetical protein F5Y05DRAFT_113380 [Hypoxylon sp. FL0543]